MIVAIGYFASALLALSLVVTNALRFRWLNLLGCLSFAVYGMCIDAFPVIVANSILLCINIYQLVKLFSGKEAFEMVAVTNENEIVKSFLKFYHSDIELFFPDFVFKSAPGKISFVVLRDLAIANIFVAQLNDNGDAVVEVNYTVEKYRDYKVGKFIFDKEKEFLLTKGVKRILYASVFNNSHENFLKVMGFTSENVTGRKAYTKFLSS